MTPLLPPYSAVGDPVPAGPEPFAGAVRAVAARHGLPDAPVERLAGGSVPVLGFGGFAVKLFPPPPPFGEHAATEAAALAHVHGRLGVPTPGLVASGEIAEWRYVVMERLPGRLLREAWEEMTENDRTDVCRRLGEAVARLHALPTEGLAVPAPEWSQFIRAQTAGCVARQTSVGTPAGWVEQVPAFLASVRLDAHGRRSLLHTELMREHVLVERRGDEWEITGLFDFEPAMVADPDYEMTSAGSFLCGHRPALFRAFLAGYGMEPDADFPRRLMAYSLLHRYSNLRWYLDLAPPRATTFDALAHEWWGLE